MNRWLCCVVAVVFCLLAAPLGAQAEGTRWVSELDEVALPSVAAPLNCVDGVQASGAHYRICMPWVWNGSLVVYAHGYVSALEPVGIPEDQMRLGNTQISTIITSLGYAFAATSYSVNGLAVREALDDLVDLTALFEAEHGEPKHIFLVGVSEGGLITSLAVERYPEVFDGGLAACGPYGGLAPQTDYLGDFRVLFDYFFPGLLPGSPTEVPEWLMADWDTYYGTEILPVILDPANASQVSQLLRTAGAAYEPGITDTISNTIETLLWYDVFATDDAIQKLGGQPIDNLWRQYRGSSDDATLNAQVQRLTPSAAARSELNGFYNPSGRLASPLVTVHTTGDPLVPYWHATAYEGKTIWSDSAALHENYAVARYGHCAFEINDVLAPFLRLVWLVNSPPPHQDVYRLYLPVTPAE